MSEPTGRPTCATVEESAPEFALGLLSGPERAVVVEHLAACADCRGLVDGLAGTVDALLAAGPVAEPPVGFETRVVDRLVAGERSPRKPGWLRWAAVAAVVALIAAGLVAGRLTAPDDAPRAARRRVSARHP